ncbi:MAG: YlmC/YmxH family sporulation protein [Clostridia bacterium]|nr:YlmC/YmxH family sporulation protein [Clostridia bacterium]
MHTALIPSLTTFSELKCKEVINVSDGSLLGCVSDIELNACTGEIRALILPSGSGILASFSSKNRLCIPWHDIERIGKDTILVRAEVPEKE